MSKKNLNTNRILNKKFNIELSGYHAKEVDMYLDKIVKDYTLYENEIETLKEKLEEKMIIISEKEKDNNKLEFEIENYKEQIKKNDKISSPEIFKIINQIDKKIDDLTKKIKK